MPREVFWLAPQDRIKVYVSVLVLAAVLATGAFALLFVGTFAWPATTIEPVHRIYAGPASRFQAGFPVTFPSGKFHLVKQPDGSFLALYWKSTHRGCTVPWREGFTFDGKQGWFRDPCSGSTWDINGVRVFGPACRDLDQFPVEVKGGRVYVLTSERLLIRGNSSHCPGLIR